MKYFTNCKTLEELRKTYKNLVKINHPDNGGNPETFKAITAEYEIALQNLKNADTTENAWKYDTKRDTDIRDILNKVVNLPDDVLVEIIGVWVWVSGNTYSCKENLKKWGFKWSTNKKAWSWHSGGRYFKKSKSKLSMNDLRGMYGSETIEKKHTDRIED